MDKFDVAVLYERASARAVDVAFGVDAAQLANPTPCSAWTVQDLLDHLVAGTDYLGGAMRGDEPVPRTGTRAADLRDGVEACVVGLRDPDARDRTCMSPLGFEWTIADATAGTFMDVLVHTWDLATATGQPAILDAELVDACVAMFLPDMLERGRAAALVGPAVEIASDAPAQDRLLAAMGRQP